jgi:Flp pilus assembly CpaE family ATPase
VINKTLTVLLIEDSQAYAELVHKWLTPTADIAFVLHWADSLHQGLESLSQKAPDVILLDLGLPDSDGSETFQTVKIYAQKRPIIILSSADSESLALQLVQDGAQDYLIKSNCTGELLSKALRYAAVRQSTQTENARMETLSDQTKVIGIMGAKGGVGATTVACHLATELHLLTNQKTLLADLDLDAGQVRFLMKVESAHTILDAASNIARLDRSCWGSMVARGPGGMDIICSPGSLGEGDPDRDRLRHALTLIRAFYNWLVIDLGRLSNFSRSLLGRVDDVLLVTTTSLPALFETRRTIEALRNTGFVGDRLRLIVNQLGNSEEFRGRDLEQIYGIPVFAKLPEAGQELHNACVNGRLSAENSDYRGQIINLARKTAGLPEEKEKPKKTVMQLLSLRS